MLSSFTDIRFTLYVEPAPQSPHEKLAVWVHACSLRVGEAETGGFLGLLGQPTHLNWLVITRPTRPCLKIQSRTPLRKNSWFVPWPPHMYTCAHSHICTYTPPHTHTIQVDVLLLHANTGCCPQFLALLRKSLSALSTSSIDT